MKVACEYGLQYEFEPARTALLSIDFQRDFLETGGMCAARGLPVGNLARILPRSARILASARQLGLMIIHTRECYAPDLSDMNAYRRHRDTIIGQQGPLGRFLIRGEPGTEIVTTMAPLPGEPVFDKASFDSFYGTRLDATLRERGITHLILMGITTQCCIASTLRGAVDHGYFNLLLADCCAAYDPAHHEATVSVIYSENHTFGWVSDAARWHAATGTLT
jgi:nicotinamidase-related amidase